MFYELLTGICKHRTEAQRTVDIRLIDWFDQMKTFSHRRSNFPSYRVGVGTVVQEGAGEFKADQMVTFRMGYPHCTRAQITRSFGKGIGGSQRGARDLKQNLCGERQ